MKAQDRLEESARAAYKGEYVAGLSAVVQKLFDEPRPVLDAVAEGPLARVLTQDRRSIETHKDAERALKETLLQVEETRAEQAESREEERSRAGELKGREGKLKASTSKLGTDKEQRIEERIEQLEVAEEAGEIQLSPASGNGNGGGGLGADRELDIAGNRSWLSPSRRSRTRDTYRSTRLPRSGTGSLRTGMFSLPWVRSSRTTVRTWVPPPPERWG